VSYFRKVFEEHPEWLREKSNDQVLARYREDHGLGDDDPITFQIRSRLANLKSVLRKKYKIGRKKKRAPQPEVSEIVLSPAEIFQAEMERLEEQIDDCLTFAKNLDRKKLASVIHHLRRARNQVVWMGGE
jgi:hypothetical protein